MSDTKSTTWKEQLKQRKWGEHKHCAICGRAVPLDRDFCSQGCRDSYQKTEKDKNKKGTWQIVLVFGVMIVMMIAFSQST